MPSPCGPGNTVCLTIPQAKITRDSLAALPLVRREAKHLRWALGRYRSAADSARAAYVLQVQASLNSQMALRDQKIEVTRARLDAKAWKGKARRRGWLNWLLAFGAAAGAGLAATR